MEVVTGAMSTLLPKLADLIKKEYNLHKTVKGEIMFLKTELEHMEAALLKFSEAPIDKPPDIQVKLWAREVRDLSYDLEDSIDAFMVRIDTPAAKQAKPYSFRGFMERSMELLTRAKVRRNIGIDMEDIKRYLKEVNERRERYKVDNIATKPHGSTVDILRLSALYENATNLIGTETKTDELVKMLMEGDVSSAQHLKMVSICGFGGLGKTTLAKVVYEKLRGEFDCGAFVSVSFNPNTKNIFKTMLYQLGHHKYDPSLDEEQLINELRDFLRDKRYLIVVDDIWKTSVWKTIRYAFIENECGSRVLSTTRILDVAKKVGAVYELQPLSRADSRKLFYLRIFGAEDKCPTNELAIVSEVLLKKCGGIPLAIISIASMLACKKEKENTHKYWSKVCQTLGRGLEDGPDVHNMRRILSISYFNLPPPLKSCMLYLSSYPEDSIISTEELIWKWIGEGFIPDGQRTDNIYEIGEKYVDELINRSMIQPLDWSTNHDCNKVSRFHVHDMVLDLVTYLSDQDAFLTTFDGQRPMDLPKKIRRLALIKGNEEDVKQLSTASFCHVRSLTVACWEGFHLLPALSKFPVLRVLDLSWCQKVDNHCFKSICTLFQLRYLGLCSAEIGEVPKQIGNLQFLEVLDLSRTAIHELPSTFGLLRKLVYLRATSLTTIPDGFGNLKSLQKLDVPTITVESRTVLNNLTGLSKLRHVRFRLKEWDETYEKPFLQCLLSLVSLEHLQIEGANCDLSSSCYRLMQGPQPVHNIEMLDTTVCSVPGWMSSLSSLSVLSIKLLSMGEEVIQVLGSIPCLSHLCISVKEPTKQARGRKLVIKKVYPFLCLSKFEICKTTAVVFAPGAMQKLETLTLKFGVQETVEALGDTDFGLENLSSLVDVSVSMDCQSAMLKDVKAVEAAIRNSIDVNPNKPTLYMMKNCVVKVRIPDKCYQQKVMETIATTTDGVSAISIDQEQGMVTVCSFVDQTVIIEKLKKAGILAELWNVTVPTAPMAST